jgi:hypothetical protein
MSAAPGPAAADAGRGGGASPRVLVAIVNYRTAALAVKCLQSLEPELQAFPGAQVVVVDNCSGDGSAEVLAQAIETHRWGAWARLVASEVNGGFSYGNNVAIAPALAAAQPPEFVWLLNPDTEVRPGAMRHLVQFLQEHPAAGIAGSSYELGDGTLWPHAFRFPSLLGEVASGLRLRLAAPLLGRHEVLMTMGSSPAPADWLPGASMMVRREVFEAVGLMDEDYFLYFEETDFCLAARRHGFECWYVPQSRVMHHCGQATGASGAQGILNRRPRYWFESRRRYFVKNHGRAYAAATDVLWSLCFLTLMARRLLLRTSTGHPPHYFRDLLRSSALFHRGLPGNPALARRAGGGSRS